jgi:hypothetical protein
LEGIFLNFNIGLTASEDRPISWLDCKPEKDADFNSMMYYFNVVGNILGGKGLILDFDWQRTSPWWLLTGHQAV